MEALAAMSHNNPNWLTKYPAEIFFGINGPKLDAYAVALEGWRRGLTLKWHSKDTPAFQKMKTWYVDRPGQLFSLADQEKEHFFFRTRGDLVSNEAVEIGADKGITKTYLEKENIPTPKGKTFSTKDSDQEIMNYAQELGFPLVIKPTDDSFGRGITANIANETEFIETLKYTRGEQGYEHIIVEKHAIGEDYRLYVVGDQVVSAVRRKPPFLIGDGQTTIKKLIKRKNKQRLKNPHLASRLIKIDREVIELLNRSGYTLKSIPKKNEQIYLRAKSNLSAGGDAHEKLEQITGTIKSIAVAAVKAIPGLSHGGVDLLIDEDNNSAVVIELNATAHIGSALFPGEGKAKDIPSAIIDYYFPESAKLRQASPIIYFPYKEKLGLLANQSLQSITVLEPPVGELEKTIYHLKGKVTSRRYHSKIKKWAKAQKNLSGYLTKKSRGEIEVVVVTNDQQTLAQFEALLKTAGDHVVIDKQTNADQTKPIKVGFSIMSKSKTLRRLKQKRYQYQFIRVTLTGFEKISYIFQAKLISNLFRRKRDEV